MKLVDVKPSIYIDFSKENNKERLKFKVGYHKRISRYKKFLTKDYVPDWSEGRFVTTKDKNTVPWTYVIRDLNPKTGWGSIRLSPCGFLKNASSKEIVKPCFFE